jgi:hypothetical protein
MGHENNAADLPVYGILKVFPPLLGIDNIVVIGQ